MPHKSTRPGFSILEGVILIAVLAFLIALVIPGPRYHGYFDRVYKDASGAETTYVLFVPHSYRGEKPYPVIFFMHGAGDAYRVEEVGLGRAIRPKAMDVAKRKNRIWQATRKNEKEFPFFVVFPRLNAIWSVDSEETRRGFEVLDQVEKDYVIDKQREYLTGLSNGGTATWVHAAKQPRRWAAIVPLSGKGLPELAAEVKHIPCWCFHGDEDKPTPVKGTRRMIDALRKAGGEPKYTEVKHAGHNTWDRAYAMPELYEWLLKQKLP